MVNLRRRRYYVVYPEYFDKNRSRSQGRRVSLDIADDGPSLAKIGKACQLLGYEYELERDKAFPSQWWNPHGRILIRINKAEKSTKEDILKEIAKILPRLVSKKKKKKKKVLKPKNKQKR